VFRGTAVVAGKTVSRVALPAEDLMQAFIYQHLVPCKEQVIMVTAPAAPFSITPRLPATGCLELPLGKEVSFPVSITRSKGFDGPVRVLLVDAPKGVTLKKGWIPAGKNNGVVSVAADSTVETKLAENMIFSGTMTLEAPAAPATAPKPPEKPTPTPTTPVKPPVAPAADTAKPAEKKTADDAPGELMIGPRKNMAAADDKTSKPGTPPPPPPPAPAAKVPTPQTKGGNAPPAERVSVMLPAVPFKMVDNPELKNAKADTPPPAPKQ
jgi:hypothetical protein